MHSYRAVIWCLALCVLPTAACEEHHHITQRLYDELSIFAHLMDVAYCISPISQIKPPFECDNQCDAFNSTEVVYQWCAETLGPSPFATSGYMAVSHEDAVLLIVLRGTRSFKDTLVDLNAEMVSYAPLTCERCRVHKGFFTSYTLTWERIAEVVQFYTAAYPDYTIKVLGHSLGGAVGVLLGLKLQHMGMPVNVITMGQPIVGNWCFKEHVNNVMNLRMPNTTGNLIRVTHRNDPVVKLPISDSYDIILGDRFMHSNGEIFINETEYGHYQPLLENVFFCHGGEDFECSAGQPFTRDTRQHLNYFRKIGTCGVGFTDFSD